jgi:aryl-alcohol dehydrogenase-like predicted oxidoreductase
MEYRMLGKSDLRISRIGFGTMSLEMDNPVSETLLVRALEGGINYFDTADLYQQGRNEMVLGRAFKGKRDRIVLATKVGNQWRTDGSGWDWVPTKKLLLKSIEQSLTRLQTDHVDLYQLHGGTMADPIDELIEAFELLKASGKIRHYGISSIRPVVIREWVKRSSIVSVMLQYSLLDRRPEEELLSFLKQHQIGVLARGSIAKGLLVDKPSVSFLNYSALEVEKAAREIKSVSGRQHTAFETAVRFVLSNDAVSSAVIGIRTEKQLLEAIAAGHLPPLDADQKEILKKATVANKYTEHR